MFISKYIIFHIWKYLNLELFRQTNYLMLVRLEPLYLQSAALPTHSMESIAVTCIWFLYNSKQEEVIGVAIYVFIGGFSFDFSIRVPLEVCRRTMSTLDEVQSVRLELSSPHHRGQRALGISMTEILHEEFQKK